MDRPDPLLQRFLQHSARLDWKSLIFPFYGFCATLSVFRPYASETVASGGILYRRSVFYYQDGNLYAFLSLEPQVLETKASRGSHRR